jgi:hypothetical protein
LVATVLLVALAVEVPDIISCAPFTLMLLTEVLLLPLTTMVAVLAAAVLAGWARRKP